MIHLQEIEGHRVCGPTGQLLGPRIASGLNSADVWKKIIDTEILNERTVNGRTRTQTLIELALSGAAMFVYCLLK